MNAILILNYNDWKTTIDFVKKIRSYSILDLILLVDNKSSDESYKVLSELKDEKIQVIETEKNAGYAYGNNYGLKYLLKHYSIKNVIISNPDIEVEERTIKKMFNYLDNHDNIAAVSGMIYDHDNSISANFAWKLPSYGHLLVSTFLTLYKIFQKVFNYGYYYNSKDIDKYNEMYVEVISGCFFAIKMKCLQKVDFFDENTFLFGEENILFFKLKKFHYFNVVLTDEKVIHHHSVSINKSIKKEILKDNILFSSNMLYLEKYLKINFVQRLIYCIFFHIGKYEKQLFNKIRK